MPRFVLLFILFAFIGAIFAGPMKAKRQQGDDCETTKYESPYIADFQKVIVECKESNVLYSYTTGSGESGFATFTENKLGALNPRVSPAFRLLTQNTRNSITC